MTYPYYLVPLSIGVVLYAAVVTVVSLAGAGLLAGLAAIYLGGLGALFLAFGLLDAYDSTWGIRAGQRGVIR